MSATSEPPQLVLRPRFSSHRELLNHLFNNKGIDLPLVKQVTHAGNVEMLTEIVCFILDRPNYPNHVPALDPGTRCSELAVINYLGINHGYKPLDDQYNILFYVLSLSKPAEVVDFFRILRSREDWTSETFRQAIKTSPLHEYVQYVRDTLVHVTAARRQFFTLSYAMNLAFNDTPDSLSRWLHTEVADADITVINPTITPVTHYKTIDSIFSELFRNGIGGVNTDIYEALLSPSSPRINASTEDNYKILQVTEECERFPLLLRQAILRFDTFALSYISIYSNDYESELLQKELKKGDITAERKEEITKLLNAYTIMKTDYRRLFNWMVKAFGVDLCTVTEIIIVFLTAKIYGDTEIQTMMTELCGINDDNFLEYNHSSRLPYIKDLTLLEGIPTATQRPDNMITTLLELFIRRNLLKPAQWILDREGKTVQELAGDANFIALTASTAVAHPSTVKWLLKQKAKLCTNSKTSSKNNIFLCCLFSLGSPESRLEMIKDAYDFATRNPAFKPEVTIEEFFEAAAMAWSSAQWQEGVGMRFELLQFTLTNLVNKEKFAALRENAEKYIKLILTAVSPEIFLLTDFTMYTPEQLAFFHSETLNFIKLVLPVQSTAAFVTDAPSFRLLFQFAFSSKHVELLRYLLEFGTKIELNEFIGLAQAASASFDYRDLLNVPTPFSTNDSTSETALGLRSYQVHPYSLTKSRSLFGEIVDLDYCDQKILMQGGLDPEKRLPPELLQQVYGAAQKSGIRDLRWDTFDFTSSVKKSKLAQQNNNDEDDDLEEKIVVGGDGYDVDGEFELYADDAQVDDSLETPEFEQAANQIEAMFAANNDMSAEKRSPFFAMFELLYNALSNDESVGTSSQVQFGSLWVDSSHYSIPVVTANHLLFSVIRPLFPARSLDIPLLSQLLGASASTSFINKRVWLDDFLFDYCVEIVGATDSKQLTKLYDDFATFIQNDQETSQYLAERDALLNKDGANVNGQCLQGENGELTLPTDAIWNVQQYFWTKMPITYSALAEDLILSVAMVIILGYVTVVSEKKYQSQQQFRREYMMAQRSGRPPPPKPFAWVTSNFLMDSARLFALLFNQIKWYPQIIFKLSLLQFEVLNVCLYGDLYDLFLSNGGELLREGIECRMHPAGYPALLPPEKIDKFFTYYQFVCADLHGQDLDHIQNVIERDMQNQVEQAEHFENTNVHHVTQPSLGQPSTKSTTSTSSYVLPVVLAVGTALAGIAGFLYWSSTDDRSQDDTPKQRRSK